MRFKPGVDRRVHVFCAAGLWTAIGLILIMRGILLLQAADYLSLGLVGILFGTIKSLLVLDRSARQGIDRIRRFADNTCIGAVYSWKTWLLVFAMLSLGFILRAIKPSPLLFGPLVIAIGWGLIFSSRHAWQAWMNWKKLPQ
ncbi:MAG: hypothetical protein HKP41_18880 [Desulfobacterales bacterium]|nr:hypothetical protein [Desulfobacterales bacterium]